MEKTLSINNKEYKYNDITHFDNIDKLPYSLRMLLESLIRQQNHSMITKEHVQAVLDFVNGKVGKESVFLPSRVVLQDFTGVPAIVDLAAMRDAMVNLGGDPKKINPEIPVDLVIDHSVMVDYAGTPDAIDLNALKEFERNGERYEFLKWAESAFENFRVVPPSTGIIHQVNIEYLSDVITEKNGVLFPDSVFGTDSHTTMINGLGVLGWGVGGIEAEAVMLGEPSALTVPEVIGVRFIGTLSTVATATDLALTVTHVLRNEKVVGKFVEFFGTGMSSLSLADRATIANMAPEYGATCGYFPIDKESLLYLENTNRSKEQISIVEEYTKVNKLFYDEKTDNQRVYTKVIEIDLSKIQPQLSGPSRPQDTVLLGGLSDNFKNFVTSKREQKVNDGKVVVAAITSCTNTSNPYVMIMAGLLAKNAVERGLSVPSWVKTSLAPGSKVVTSYLEKAGLLPYLEHLGFNVVGYGCTTCIGNSGPLSQDVEDEITNQDLIVASVLSGNRNFEGRIHPLVKANYLASPPLVVAYALAGWVTKNLETDTLGNDKKGDSVYLKDIFPTNEQVQSIVSRFVNKELYEKSYKEVFIGNPVWNAIKTTTGQVYNWDENSTYIGNPPYFEKLTSDLTSSAELSNLKVLALFGDSITTDHISPAGSIAKNSPAGNYLVERGVALSDFNSYGARRGNDKIMTRGTFANIRIKNKLVPDIEGGYTDYNGENLSIYDAAQKYKEKNTGLIILAGKDYGMGSSRDWAAKGSKLLGVRAVIAESFERIHRSNLVMMGVVPLQFLPGDTVESRGLTGKEVFSIDMPKELQIGQLITVIADDKTFDTILRFDSLADIEYYKNDGIMPYVIRKKLG